jgi:trans-aconitate 2-methyltransferase
MAAIDTWDPRQYDKFQREREQPFYDLLALVRVSSGMRVVDLGCGTGKLTRVLHDRLDALETVGIDRSGNMLESMREAALPFGLRFEVGTIEAFAAASAAARSTYDLIFSNAAFHWVGDHATLLPRLAAALVPGGQLAFQVPAQHEDPTHVTADELADTEPFRTAFGGWRRVHSVQSPEQYARLFHTCGFADPNVRLIVYPHVLASREAVVEWMKGTLLTEYARHLPADLFERFVEDYRARLLPQLDAAQPYFFPFKRILCWGQRSAPGGHQVPC